VADEFVGVTQQATSRYALVYRSIDHRILRDICTEAKKQTSSTKYAAYLPAKGFGKYIQEFATIAIRSSRKTAHG